MSFKADVLVVGLGAMGSAVLYQLAKRGVKALGIDRFAPPHAMGSSHGETRITRQAVGEGKDYVPLVLASHRIWRELVAETGERLLDDCGVLVMAPGIGKTSHHGKPDFVARSIAAARAFDIPHEVLDGAEVARRFPQFLKLQGDETAYFEPGGGYVRPERCIAAQLARATALGAGIRTGVEILAIAQTGSGVRVDTSVGALEADQVVVSAGAWTAPLLGAPFDRLLTVSRQVLHWYELDDTSAYRADAPAFIWMHGATMSTISTAFHRWKVTAASRSQPNNTGRKRRRTRSTATSSPKSRPRCIDSTSRADWPASRRASPRPSPASTP